MRKLLYLALLLCPPFMKTVLLRWFCGAKIGRGVRIGWFAAVMARRIEIGDYALIRSFSTVRCREVEIGAYSVIGSYVQVYGPGCFTMGRHSIVGSHCLINVWEDVRMGDIAALGSRCMIMTHGVFLPYTEGYWVKFAGVTIGSRVWIAAGVFIQPGVKIGNEVFVNAMSVVKKDLPDGAVAEGYPAKEVARIERLRRTMTPKALDAAARAMLSHFAEVALRRERGVSVAEDAAGRLRFRSARQDYFVGCVPSEGPAPTAEEAGGARRVVLVVSRPGWAPPPEMRHAAVIDLTTTRTPRPRDGIHAALAGFLWSHYGVPLEYGD